MSINPDEVPAFPAYFLRLDTDADTATLEGIRVEPAAGTDIRQAALQAVAAKAHTHGLTAVRVTLEDQEGDRWKMIVAADGEAIDITTDEAEEHSQSPKRRHRLIIGSAAAVVLLGGAITAGTWIVSSLTGSDSETGPPPWEIPGEGEEIPIAVPDGYEQVSAWSVDVTEDSGAMQISDGRIINAHADGTMLAREADTAEPTWQATNAPDDINDLHQVRWNDRPALSAVENNTLYIWPLADELEAEPTEPVTFDLSNDAEVSYADVPLIDLGDFVVAVPTDEGLTQVNVPVGTDPVAATGEEVISIDAEQIYRTPLEGDEEITTIGYERHSDSSGRADALWPITDTVVLGQWNDEDGDPMLQAIDITSGERLVSTTTSTTPGNDPDITVDEESDHALIGDVTLSYGTDAAFGSVPAVADPVLNNGTIYGNTQNGPARIDFPQAGDENLHPDDDALTHWETFADDDVAPQVVTGDAVYLQASRLDETLLYRADLAPEDETAQQDDAQADDEAGADQDSEDESEDNDASAEDSDDDQSDEDD